MNKFIIIPLLLTGVVSLTAATAAGTIQEPAPADSAYAAEPAVPGAFFGTSQARTTGAVSTVDGVSLGKTTAPNLPSGLWNEFREALRAQPDQQFCRAVFGSDTFSGVGRAG